MLILDVDLDGLLGLRKPRKREHIEFETHEKIQLTFKIFPEIKITKTEAIRIHKGNIKIKYGEIIEGEMNE